jgi:hypothetical protein
MMSIADKFARLNRVTVGTDPEYFIQDQNGKFISAVGLIGAGKQNPLSIEELGNGYNVHEDNVAIELNVPAAEMGSTLAERLLLAQKYVNEKYLVPNGYRFSDAASAIFDADQLQTDAAREFGCDPDFDVYDLHDNPRPSAKNKCLRSAGGHIHIGLDIADTLEETEKIFFSRFLDIAIGVPLALCDNDRRRMKLYGKAGAIRFKPYGIEYRTPSNWWTLQSATASIVGENVINSAYVFSSLIQSYSTTQEMMKIALLARSAINTADKHLLKDIARRYLQKNFGNWTISLLDYRKIKL